ncbi:hypothetical protein ACT4US_30735 [Bacillus sp. HC-Mk]
MLSFFFALMVLPGTDGRVDKTAKEEDKADEQYDTGHATVKSVSFSHTGCLTHKINGTHKPSARLLAQSLAVLSATTSVLRWIRHK